MENKTYNFNYPNIKKVKDFQEMEINPELEGQIKSDIEKRLSYIEDSLNMLNEETAKEIVVASTALSSFAVAEEFLKKTYKKKDEE